MPFIKNFLAACKNGDFAATKHYLSLINHPNDSLIQKGLKLSIENKNFEITRLLLDKCSGNELRESLLLTIFHDDFESTEYIVKHTKYKVISKLTRSESFWQFQISNDSQFSCDITPLQLASQLNRTKIVRFLLKVGYKIEKPHSYNCKCKECLNKIKLDSVRHAQSRLNSYKGLTSETYISLTTFDPIQTCFELRSEVLFLAKQENMFKV